MDAATLKILKFLESFTVGDFQDITPTLLTIYSGVDPKDYERVKYESPKVENLLKSMEDKKLVLVRRPHLGIGGGSETDGYRWIDKQKYSAAMQPDGVAALEEEQNKSLLERLNESIIEANQSTRDTNFAVVQNIKFQKKVQIWTLVLGGLSTVFIFATVILSIADKIPQRLQGIETQVKEQSKMLEQLSPSLKEVSHSIQTLTDSLTKTYNK
jgi:hypothetical protein